MATEANNSQEPRNQCVTIAGLRKKSELNVNNPELFSATLTLGGDEPVSRIWKDLDGADMPHYRSLQGFD